MKKRLNLGSSCIIITLILSFVQYPTLAQNTDHDTLIIGIEELPDIDIRNTSGASYYEGVSGSVKMIYWQYMGGLGMHIPSDSYEILPGIAESWIHNDNFTEWTFTLREGATFHDGRPIDAKTVKYSYYANLLVMSNNTNSPMNNISNAQKDSEKYWYYYSGITGITYPENDPNGDGRIVIFTLGDSIRLFDWYSMWDWAIVPVPYGSHGDYGDSTEVCMQKAADFISKPVMAGPYKILDWQKDDYALLERFDNWFGWGETFTGAKFGTQCTIQSADQAFKYLEFKILPESIMYDIQPIDIKNNLTTGNVDLIIFDYHISEYLMGPTRAQSLSEIDEEEGFSVRMAQSAWRVEMVMNIQGNWPIMFGGRGNYPVSEPWFRQAISHAIDRNKMVTNAFQSYAYPADSLFLNPTLEYFSDIDTSNYYDYAQGSTMAEAILESKGYTALSFEEERDNRFGWGDYANETEKDGVPQTKGRHFWLITSECLTCEARIESIQEDLRNIGIYVDIDSLPPEEYFNAINGDAGMKYNTSLADQDPEFHGPACDFFVSGLGPHTFPDWALSYYTNVRWYYGGATHTGWFNNSSEIAYAKMNGGYWGLDLLPYAEIPPETPYPIPEISNDDPQYIEGAEEAGEIFSRDLPVIPLVWASTIYVINNNILNFVVTQGRGVYLWNTSWRDEHENTSETIASTSSATSIISTTSQDTPILGYIAIVNICMILIVYRLKKKQ